MMYQRLSLRRNVPEVTCSPHARVSQYTELCVVHVLIITTQRMSRGTQM